jgi:hypothetical protein
MEALHPLRILAGTRAVVMSFYVINTMTEVVQCVCILLLALGFFGYLHSRGAPIGPQLKGAVAGTCVAILVLAVLNLL